MSVNLSIKNVPDNLAAKLRKRAEANHRSLQGELMALLEASTSEVGSHVARNANAEYKREEPPHPTGSLLDRLLAMAGDRGIDSTRRLTREQAHDRRALRKVGV